jgi:hypothetical protein
VALLDFDRLQAQLIGRIEEERPMTNLYPTPRAPDAVFEGWRQERQARELQSAQHAHEAEMAQAARGQVTRAIFWGALIASPTLRKVVAVLGAVILVLSMILLAAGGEVGILGALLGIVLLGAAGIAKLGSMAVSVVARDVREEFGGAHDDEDAEREPLPPARPRRQNLQRR